MVETTNETNDNTNVSDETTEVNTEPVENNDVNAGPVENNDVNAEIGTEDSSKAEKEKEDYDNERNPKNDFDFSKLEVFDDSIKEELKALAEEVGADTDKSQKLADFMQNTIKKYDASFQQALDKEHTTWKEELASDKDYGGHNLEDTTKRANRVLSNFGDATLKEFAQTGVLDHPSMVKMLARIDKRIGEGQGVPQSNEKTTKKEKSIQERLFGTTS